MRKALLGLLAAAVVAAIAFALLSAKTTRAAKSREWPAGLGTIESVSKRFPTATPAPDLVQLMRAHRALVRSARERARRGDAGAWDDLRASWKLTGELWQRPELISCYIALAIARGTIEAAREMPLPAPAWLGAMLGFDYRKAMLAAMQGEAWMLSRRIGENTLFAADMLAHFREMAADAAAIEECAFDSSRFRAKRELPWWNVPAKRSMPNVMAAWQRVARLRAEVELTERALQLRRGEAPSPQSLCSDGSWIVTTYSVRFSRDMPASAPGLPPVPLQFALDPRERGGDGLEDL